MPRYLLPLLTLLLAFVLPEPSPAEACSCGRATPKMLVKQADQVVLARAGKTVETKDGFTTEFEVLHAMKGELGESFVWKRSKVKPPCELDYAPGEVSLLFVVKGDLDRCAGNYGIAEQAVAMPSYLRSTKTKISELTSTEMQVLLGHALKGYLHQRASVRAYHTALRGKSVEVEGSKIRFQAVQRHPRRNAIAFFEALRAGPVLYLSGSYRMEGIRFRVILLDTEDGQELMFKELIED